MIRRKRMAAKALLFFFAKKEEGLMPLVLTPRALPAEGEAQKSFGSPSNVFLRNH